MRDPGGLQASMHSPRLAGQIGGARTEQGRGGGDVRSGRLREPRPAQDAPVHARPGGVPASVVRSSPHHGQSLSRMQPGAHRPFERPLRPEDRGVFILKRARHFERTTEYSTAQMRNSGGASPASVVQSSPHHDQAPSRMRPGAHRPFARPARPEDRGVFILKSAPALHASRRARCTSVRRALLPGVFAGRQALPLRCLCARG